MDIHRPSEPTANHGICLFLGALGAALAVGITVFLTRQTAAVDKASMCTAAAASAPAVREVHLTYTQLPVFPIQ